MVAISRALNGIGLALVSPAIQSLVADLTDDNNRGSAFGWLQLTGNLGSIIGGLLSVLIAPITFMGIPDSNAKDRDTVKNKTFWFEVKDLVQEAKSVINIPSFQIIVGTGCHWFIPMVSSVILSYVVRAFWLLPRENCTFLIALFVMASSFGGLFGGMMGDILSTRLPNFGRIILAQTSSASAIPLAAILLLALPNDPSSGVVHGFVLFILGFCISWNAPATNK
ncbi:hypothetical protein CFP56_024518 [Quercus suber]|uniref:Major facilitator superfamily (MFS) profile domain-containing protein n=1 Tax=Quercus suber TaxID=58331 RepID=A0AAW0LWY6_QUESU